MRPALPARGKSQKRCPSPEELLRELFHGLSQPLSTLRCSLELALRRQPLTATEYRDLLQHALAQAEHAACLIVSLREMLESGEPGEQPIEARRSRKTG